MRPPDLPGGNAPPSKGETNPGDARFNEAAGFTRRKLRWRVHRGGTATAGFNEAAGFTRRKRSPMTGSTALGYRRFNEAAGFTRRKPAGQPRRVLRRPRPASMRPPDLPGGNEGSRTLMAADAQAASMRPPDLPGGNIITLVAADVAASSALQ